MSIPTLSEPKDMLAVIGRVPLQPVPDGWVRVRVSAAALNYHDVLTLQGVGTHSLQYPRILGCEGCDYLNDGTPVNLYSVMCGTDYLGEGTLDHSRNVFHEITDGTLAEYVVAPSRNVLPLLLQLDPVDGAVLGIAWFTAYRMIFTKANLRPRQKILVQGSSGGVSTALIQLGAAAGLRVWCTGRSPEKRQLAQKLGAEEAFEAGATLPHQVDAVFDTSGDATWSHSMAAVKLGGSIVTCGVHGGFHVSLDLLRVFNDQITIHGVYAGTLQEFQGLIQIGTILPLSKGGEGLRALHTGSTNGKIVLVTG
ncbi:hypothetical protein V8C35DRAFT_326140 [Trichoderma chlorosporum]